VQGDRRRQNSEVTVDLTVDLSRQTGRGTAAYGLDMLNLSETGDAENGTQKT
jgi:hypothetical protein